MSAILFFGLANPTFAAHFPNPKWNGYALDWCQSFENYCGKPAADQWCQKHGYPMSSGFQIRPLVNFETMTIGQNAICNPADHRCDSFTYIDCKEASKVFTYPTYNGYRLDWCRTFENECGAPAAQAYCQKNGYSHVLSFQILSHQNQLTMTIGSNAICNPQFHVCDSFATIRCGN